MAKYSGTIVLLALFICIAVSLTVAGEFSGEFGRIRNTLPQALNITKSEFVTLNNGVVFGFDVDSEGKDVLRVKLATNQTYSWYRTIQVGGRIVRNENFTLEAKTCSFEIDVGVKFYDKQTLQIIDHTESVS